MPIKRKDRMAEFRVVLRVPAEADIEEARQYVIDAVYSWRGSLRPPRSYGVEDEGDPMWHLDPETIKVSKVHPTKRRSR